MAFSKKKFNSDQDRYETSPKDMYFDVSKQLQLYLVLKFRIKTRWGTFE